MTSVSQVIGRRSVERPLIEREQVIARMQRQALRSRRLQLPKAIAMVLLSIGMLVTVWQAMVAVFDTPTYALPSPFSVAEAFVDSFSILVEQAVPTLTEILVGFGLTVTIFVPLGIAIAQWRVVEGLVNPLLVIAQTTPMIALAPLLITLWGFGMQPKVVMVVLISFFPVVVNTVVGIKSAAPEVVDLGRSMGASRVAMLFKVRLPGALPSMFAGVRVAITLAVIGAVVGEFAGSDDGLGHLIVTANGRLNTPLVFASVVALSVIGLVLYKLVEWIEWLAIPWHRDKRARSSGG